MRVFRVILVMVGLGLAAAAGWVGIGEYRSFFQRSGTPEEVYARLDPVRFGLVPSRTIIGAQAQMVFCINRQNTYLYPRSPEAVRLALTRACLARAESILATSPSRSLAHLERADALWRLDRAEEAADALETARATGAREGWMAVVRVRTALHLAGGDRAVGDGAPVNPDLRARMLALAGDDLAVLATAADLNDRLVGLYLGTPAFHDWFVGMMEAQPDGAQQRFLRGVRRVRAGGADHD